MRVDFIHLACGAAFDIGCDEVVHMGPLVMLLDQVDGFEDSGVASG